MLELARLFPKIEELAMLHFPSGAESEINQRLMEKFAAIGVNAWVDRANNGRTLIPVRNPKSRSALPLTKNMKLAP
jgi:putative aminopeptidase FrvX